MKNIIALDIPTFLAKQLAENKDKFLNKEADENLRKTFMAGCTYACMFLESALNEGMKDFHVVHARDIKEPTVVGIEDIIDDFFDYQEDLENLATLHELDDLEDE